MGQSLLVIATITADYDTCVFCMGYGIQEEAETPKDYFKPIPKHNVTYFST